VESSEQFAYLRTELRVYNTIADTLGDYGVLLLLLCGIYLLMMLLTWVITHFMVAHQPESAAPTLTAAGAFVQTLSKDSTMVLLTVGAVVSVLMAKEWSDLLRAANGVKRAEAECKQKFGASCERIIKQQDVACFGSLRDKYTARFGLRGRKK
jgi:hypothetical protein